MQEAWREPGVVIPIYDPMLPGQDQEAWFSYTSKQRQWWLRVYENKCHFPLYNEKRGAHICGSKTRIEIHHITPSAFIKEQEPWSDPNAINFTLRHVGIALCREHHDKIIHPDIGDALANYGKDKDGIKKAILNHHDLARAGIVFWNNEYDDWLLEIARRKIDLYRTRNALDSYPSDQSWKKTPHPKKPTTL